MKLSMKQCRTLNNVLTAINRYDNAYSFQTGRTYYIAKIELSQRIEADCAQSVMIYVHSNDIEFYSESYCRELFEVLDSNRTVYLKDKMFHDGKARLGHSRAKDGESIYKAYAKVDSDADATAIAQAMLSTMSVAYYSTRQFSGYSKDEIKKFLDGRVKS